MVVTRSFRTATVAGSLAFSRPAPLLGGAVVGEVTHPKNRKQAFLDRWLPGSLGGVAGVAAFIYDGMGTASGGSLQRLPVWPSNLGEDLGSLSAGLLGGLIGCGLGLLFLQWRGWLEQRQLLAQHGPGAAGLLFGACRPAVAFMHWLPLVPFAGEEHLRLPAGRPGQVRPGFCSSPRS